MKKGEIIFGLYAHDGVTWRCAWRWWPKDSPGRYPTTVWLRRQGEGPGRSTHTAIKGMPPDIFKATYLDGVPFARDSLGPVTFT